MIKKKKQPQGAKHFVCQGKWSLKAFHEGKILLLLCHKSLYNFPPSLILSLVYSILDYSKFLVFV